MEETDASSILLSSANHAHGVSGVQSIHYIISMVCFSHIILSALYVFNLLLGFIMYMLVCADL